MLNISRLARKLDQDSAAAPLESGDLRLEAITSLVSKGDYQQAAEQADALLGEGQYDARILGPYLYGVFLQEEIPGLPALLDSVGLLLTDSLPALSPPSKGQQFLDTTLTWLFQTINRHLERVKKRGGAELERLRDPARLKAAAVRDAMERCEAVVTAATAALKKPKCAAGLRQLGAWLLQLHRTLPQEPQPAPEIREDEPVPSDELQEPAVAAPPPTPMAPAPAQQDQRVVSPQVSQQPQLAVPGVQGQTLIEGSAALGLLLRKLQGFELLVRRQEYLKAAIISNDLQQIMEDFNPKIYLPRLFSTYCSLLAAHVQDMEPCMDDLEGRQGKALTQLYQVDPEEFLREDPQS